MPEIKVIVDSGRLQRVQSVFTSLPKNVEFQPRQIVGQFVQSLGLSEAQILDILYTPNIWLYEDVFEFFDRLFQNDVVPVIWTQGEVQPEYNPWSSNNNPTEIGFQPLKIERSGLLSYLRTYQELYDERGISPVIGGRNKVHPDITAPVIQQAFAQGIRRVMAIDDRADTLSALHEQLLPQGIESLSCYHITRDREVIPDSLSLRGVRSLSEVEIMPGELCLVDFDRTLAKTDEMKLDLCERLAALLPFGTAA